MNKAPASTSIERANGREIGKQLRQLRRQRGISQGELGAALGITHQQIQKYESGASRLSFVRLLLICEHLRINIGIFVPQDLSGGPSAEEYRPTRHAQGDILRKRFEMIEDDKVRVALSNLIEHLSEALRAPG